MKKFLCLFLSLLMIVSSCVVFSASAEDVEDTTAGDESGFDFDEKLNEMLGNFTLDNYTLPDFSGFDIDALIASGVLADIDVGGVSLDFIYNSTDALPWSNMVIDKSSVYLAMGNVNLYFKNLLYKSYKDKDIFTSQSATWLANKIVDIFFGTDAPDVTVKLSETGDELVFVKAVIAASKSGITNLVEYFQSVWVDSGLNFWPMLYALGVNFDEIYVKNSAQEILEQTLLDLINNFRADPLYSIIDILWAVARHYQNFMLQPISAGLSSRIIKGAITEEQLKQPHNIFNLIFNDNNSNDTGHLQFLTIPYQRFTVALDRTECFYYMMIYTMLLGSYSNNSAVFNQYKNDTQANEKLEQADRDIICELIDGFTAGQLDKVMNFVVNMFKQNIIDTTGNVFKKIIDRIREILENFVKYLDRIFGFAGHWT